MIAYDELGCEITREQFWNGLPYEAPTTIYMGNEGVRVYTEATQGPGSARTERR